MKVVLLDVGGVIRDLRPSYEAFIKALQMSGVRLGNFGYEEYRSLRCIAESTKEFVELLLERRNIRDDDLVERVVREYRKIYYSPEFRRRLFPWAKEALYLLKTAGLSLGIVTNSSRKTVEKDLGDLINLFDVVVGREDAKIKPNPDGILAALSTTGHSRDEAVYVGDSKIDALAARGAGVLSIGVETGFCDRERLERYFDRVYRDLFVFAKEIIRSADR